MLREGKIMHCEYIGEFQRGCYDGAGKLTIKDSSRTLMLEGAFSSVDGELDRGKFSLKIF